MEEAVYALGDEAFGILAQVCVQRWLELRSDQYMCKRDTQQSVAGPLCALWPKICQQLQVQKYIDQEIRSEINQLPPFEDGLALNVIRAEARRHR